MIPAVRPSVVILDIKFAGYGIIRSLGPYDIPLVGVKSAGFEPVAYSKYLSSLLTFQTQKELLEKLVNFATQQLYKPILWLTSDYFVAFALQYREQLEALYIMDLPENRVCDKLLNKSCFVELAQQLNLSIPKTLVVSLEEDWGKDLSDWEFPVVIKPFLRGTGWKKAKFPKAFLAQSVQEVKKILHKIRPVEDKLLIQEWIPGGDELVYYCLAYYSKKGDCLAYFSGHKIRQWPVALGSTATTKPVEEETVIQKTLELFNALSFSGFGSVEFKKHAINGQFYIMEPTVGRPNQQEYVATLNGINIPLLAYQALTSKVSGTVSPCRKTPVIYIDSLAELRSAFVQYKRNGLRFGDWLKSIEGRKAYRFFSWNDPMVGLMTLAKFGEKFLNRYIF